jgi:hypothetical protein
MKTLAPRILEINGLDPKGVTPYVDETPENMIAIANI